MFHWICPECGQEIAPGVKECPVCEPQATAAQAQTAVSAAPVAEPPASSLKQPTASPAPLPNEALKQPVPEPQALQSEVILRPEAVLPPKAFAGPKPPVVLDAIPSEARPVLMPDVPLGTSPVELPDPLLETVSDRPPQPETFADRLADLADLLHGQQFAYTAPRIFQESAAPFPRAGTSRETAPLIVDVSFDSEVPSQGEESADEKPEPRLLAAPRSPLLLAEPQPPSVGRELPLEAFRPRPARHASPVQESTKAEPSAPSPVRLPDPPNRVAAPALAPLRSYRDAADRLMRPVDNDGPALSAQALPKTTLPGPALPRELVSLQAAGLVPIRSGGRRGALPVPGGGLLKYIVIGILLTAGVATYSMLPGTPASAPPKQAPVPAPDPPAPVRSARSTNSLARFVEVTGIRFMEVNKKPQIHYLVVNHSSAPLSSVTVYVTLRAADATPGQPPIARLNFRSPALAAFEAKEMFSSIEQASAPLDLPDWQDLHADVEVQ